MTLTNKESLYTMDLFTASDAAGIDLLGAIESLLYGGLSHNGYFWEQDGSQYRLFYLNNPYLLGTATLSGDNEDPNVVFSLRERSSMFTGTMVLSIGANEEDGEWEWSFYRDYSYTPLELEESVECLKAIDARHKAYR